MIKKEADKKEPLKLINFYLDKNIYKQITDFCDKNNISYASMLRVMITKEILNLDKLKEEADKWR